MACGGPRENEDAARICLSDRTADAPLVVHAEASAGCHIRDLVVGCDAELDGDTVRVSTVTSWVRTEPLAMSCESILVIATSTCETEPLPAGTYTLDYAGSQVDFEVPGPADACLDGVH